MTQEDQVSENPRAGHSTERLARETLEGRAASFDALYRRLAPALLSWARLRCRPGMDPEDLVQEVWIRACARFETFDPDRLSFRPWLFAVAKYVALEQLRQAIRASRDQQVGGPETRQRMLAECPEAVTSFTQRLARDELVRCFVEAALRLPAEERQILVHCGLEGMTCEQAATRLGMSVTALRKRWQRLRERLREVPRLVELVEAE